MANSVIKKDIVTMFATATKSVGANEKAGFVTVQVSIPTGYEVKGCTVKCSHSNILVSYLGVVDGVAFISYSEMNGVARSNEPFVWYFILGRI